MYSWRVAKFAVLETEWPLQLVVSIVGDTSATGYSQSLVIQSVCMIGNPSEPS